MLYLCFLPASLYFSKPKKRILHFANVSLYFHDYLYTAKYFHLPFGEQSSTFPYWRLRLASVILPNIITPLDSSSQKSVDSKILRQTFFSRTVEAKEPLSNSSNLVKASTAKLLNQTDFQTEY